MADTELTTTAPQLSAEEIQEFVLAAHGNEPKVREMHAKNPFLLNAVWEVTNETALQAASHTGRRGIALYLLSQGAPIDICAAAMLGNAEEVARFLEQDPSLANARGAHGITVMYHAALSGNTQVTEMLLSHGGGEGIDHALHAAVLFNHVEMVRWLLEHGVQNPNAPNYEDKTPLRAALDMDRPEIASLLRQHGASEQT